MYTWNARTGYLDALAEHSGLEVTGHLLLPGTWAKSEISKFWGNYIALIDVAEENSRLREEKNKTDQYLASVRDDLAELARLRGLIGLKPPARWRTLGARVLAGRFGPGASLETVMIDRGFATGAPPGTPIATQQGLVGRVFRASPHIATVLLLTDQSFRAAVVTADGRVPGVIMGGGPRAHLEVKYLAPNVKVEVGELLITSGLDDTFPKGLPVARVVTVEPGMKTLFQQVQAEPLASPDSLEEVLLLISPENWPAQVAMPDIVPGVTSGQADQAAPSATEPQPAGVENAR